jgi:hypothetical protein
MFEQFSRLFLMVLSYIVVSSLVYILPAVAASIIVWDKTVYYSCVTHPGYACLFGIMSFVSVGVYIADKADQGLI